MSLPIVFRRAARFEFDEAADWYDTRRPGRGTKFTAAVGDLIDRIVVQPDLFPIVLEDIREAPVSGFPYCVYYRLENEQILIVSVFHTSRDPGIWQNRM